MQFGDREKKLLGYLVLVIGILVASYFGAYNGVPPLPPIPQEQGPSAQSVPTQPGPPGDFVSMGQGGTFGDAIAISVPTANATADTAFSVNNLSVAQPFSIQDAGTPVLEGYDGGGVKAYAPTAVATTVPGMVVDSAGVSNLFEIRDAGTPVWYVANGGGVTQSGSTTFSGGQTVNNWVKVAAPTAIATATPAMVVDSLGVSTLLEVRDAATPVFTVLNGGNVTGKVIRYSTSGEQLVCGTTAITGTGTAVHGLTTPSYCMATLKDDFGADGGFVSCAISGATVTLKQWKINATPTAGSETDVNVGWCVIGTP